MRNTNCLNVRHEIEEAAGGSALSVGVNRHLEICESCQTVLREQTKLRELVSSLGTVEAPGDFDFRLRARLAAEKQRRTVSLNFIGLSLGFRSATVASILLLIGFALVFVSLRTPNTPVARGVNSAKPADAKVTDPRPVEATSSAPSDQIAKGTPAGDETSPVIQRHGARRQELASRRAGNSQRTQELSATGAQVLTRYDELAATYPTTAFPINASYQSLKVSVDNGRGTSRTISLPTVSFGSQSSLSPSSTPLMASARDAW